LNRNNINTDKIIRDKFELYAPVPPKHIWAGIENGLNLEPVIPYYKNKKVVSIAVLVMLALMASFFIINPKSYNSTLPVEGQSALIKEEVPLTSVKSESDDINVVDEESLKEDANAELKPSSQIEVEQTEVNEEPIVSKIATAEIVDKSSSTSTGKNNALYVTQQNTSVNSLSIIKLNKSVFITTDDYNDEFVPETPNQESVSSPVEIIQPKSVVANSHWKIGGYLSPEVAISDFDSVEILNSYTFSIEPTYTINNHWFVRSGVGVAYVRDRGFAEIKYISNDYMGSYDDVYDITFDTLSGIVTPIYHTKTVEIWDSVQHVTVSNVTNKYTYLQVPLLVGYSFRNKESNINWYFMGGPAFNVKIASWIDNPKPENKDAEIISLHNNLPVRSNSYFQFWIGAGLEYQLNSKLSVAVEPIYRYYVNSIYNSSYGSSPSSSGLTLRFGLVYKIK